MEKCIIDGKVRSWHHKIFTIETAGESEQEIVVHFGQRVDYRVVKLDFSDLPGEDDKHRKITWFNNFAIQDSSGRKYMKNVHYTVFVPKLSKDQVFVYYANGQLKEGKKPTRVGTKPPRRHMVQVELNAGDPGVGCRSSEGPIQPPGQ